MSRRVWWILFLMAGCEPTGAPPTVHGAPHACAWRWEEQQTVHLVDDGADDATIRVVPGNGPRRGTFSLQVEHPTAPQAATNVETDPEGFLVVDVADLGPGWSWLHVRRRDDHDGTVRASLGVLQLPADQPALLCAGHFDAQGAPLGPGIYDQPLTLRARAYQADGLRAAFWIADRDPRAFSDDEFQTLASEQAVVADDAVSVELTPDPRRADDPLETGGPDVVGWVSLLDDKGPLDLSFDLFVRLAFAEE